MRMSLRASSTRRMFLVAASAIYNGRGADVRQQDKYTAAHLPPHSYLDLRSGRDREDASQRSSSTRTEFRARLRSSRCILTVDTKAVAVSGWPKGADCAKRSPWSGTQTVVHSIRDERKCPDVEGGGRARLYRTTSELECI